MSTTVTLADDETTTTGDEQNADKSPDSKHRRVRLDRLESRSFPGRNKWYNLSHYTDTHLYIFSLALVIPSIVLNPNKHSLIHLYFETPEDDGYFAGLHRIQEIHCPNLG
jgi:hypothetical protein